MCLTIVAPQETCGKVYKIASDVFKELWYKITGESLIIISDAEELPDGNVVFIGSDTVNRHVRQLVIKGELKAFKLRSSSDDYAIVSRKTAETEMLFIAGATGRSTIYAVYDFFRKQAGAEYYWDGDSLPESIDIDISSCNYFESPRFDYRGLRYFAHRGLHRFQAEHWDFEDWKREIDWLMKKRLNIFMLRIGLDDLFQRAFPNIVPYPPHNSRDPDYIDRSYNDRTSFWSLKERGILRKKVLDYAFERGLLHPEDTGTMTHWYSRTPSPFIEKRPVEFLKQSEGFYQEATGMVWNIYNEQSWNDYWRLTEKHIEDFGQGQIFHTIGLAERCFGQDREENLRIKKWVYRKIQQKLRDKYPNQPLMIASWDFAAFWQDSEVKELLSELNKGNTLILDYAADMDGKTSFEDWGFYKNHPWIFGIFHAFEPETVIHGKYKKLANKIRKAAADEYCQGMVFWPEASHIDSLMLEYFAAVSWDPESADINIVIKDFCHNRYRDSKVIDIMSSIWETLVEKVLFEEGWNTDFMDWNKSFQFEPHFRLLDGEMFKGYLLEKQNFFRINYTNLKKVNCYSAEILSQLTNVLHFTSSNHFLKRDIVDICRTLLNLKIRENILGLVLNLLPDKNDLRSLDEFAEDLTKQFDLLAQVLSLHDDFSIYKSFVKLGSAHDINPFTEQTLKSNIENSYSRGHAYELAKYVYIQEYEVFREAVTACANAGKTTLPYEILQKKHKEIQDNFYSLGLKDMSPQTDYDLTETISKLI